MEDRGEMDDGKYQDFFGRYDFFETRTCLPVGRFHEFHELGKRFFSELFHAKMQRKREAARFLCELMYLSLRLCVKKIKCAP